MESEVCKVCKVCKELLNIDNFRKREINCKIYILNQCKKCLYIKNSDNIKKYAIENKEKLKKYHSIYNIKYSKNRIKKPYKEYNKIYNSTQVNNLTDKYIINKITRDTSLNTETIKQYPELIETKRLQILTKRLCRTSQN